MTMKEHPDDDIYTTTDVSMSDNDSCIRNSDNAHVNTDPKKSKLGENTLKRKVEDLQKSIKNTNKDPLVVGWKILNDLRAKEAILKSYPRILIDPLGGLKGF